MTIMSSVISTVPLIDLPNQYRRNTSTNVRNTMSMKTLMPGRAEPFGEAFRREQRGRGPCRENLFRGYACFPYFVSLLERSRV